MVETLL